MTPRQRGEDFGQKLDRATLAVVRALRAERAEAVMQFIESLFCEGDWRGPDETPTLNVGKSRRRPNRDEDLVPGAGADMLPHVVRSRASFYKHLKRELANSKRRQLRNRRARGFVQRSR